MNGEARKVAAFLAALGVQGAEGDPLLDYALASAAEQVEEETGRGDLPEALSGAWLFLAAGQYLKLKRGLCAAGELLPEAAVRQVQEGDTNVVYALPEGDATPEGRLEGLISFLMNCGNARLANHRVVKW